LGLCFQTGTPIPPSAAPTSEGHPSGSDNLREVFNLDDQLEEIGEAAKQIDFIADFVLWITESDFLRLQELEPIVGGPPPTNYPPAVDALGIRGQSVYTALFHHLDMERFTCKICAQRAEGELEDAITHQRITHFHHYPYRCLPTLTQWYVSFLFLSYEDHIPVQWAALRKPSGAVGTPTREWALGQDGNDVP